MRRLHAFLEESNSAVIRRLHRQLAQELAAWILLPVDSPVSVPSRPVVSHRSVSRTQRSRRLKGAGGGDSSMRSKSGCRPPSEASTVHGLMDLALPRFAGMGDGPHQVHPPWALSSDSPTLPAACRLATSGEEDLRLPVDQMSVSSACLNRDMLSSSDDDSRDSAGHGDLSITLLCESEEVRTLLIPSRSPRMETYQRNLCLRTRDRSSGCVPARRTSR